MTQSQKDAFYDKMFAMIVNELKEDEEFMKYVLNSHFGMTKKEVLDGKKSRDVIAKQNGNSHEQIRRYICFLHIQRRHKII